MALLPLLRHSLALLLLSLVHAVHLSLRLFRSLRRRRRTPSLDAFLQGSPKVPRSLALILVQSETKGLWGRGRQEGWMVESVRRVREWCEAAGVKELDVYDEHGVLVTHFPSHAAPTPPSSTKPALLDSPPLSPPLTPTSSNASLPATSSSSTITKRSASSLKPAVSLLVHSRTTHLASFLHTAGFPPAPFRKLTVPIMDKALREQAYPHADPELIVVHELQPSFLSAPVGLRGFPAWQLRLGEIYADPPRPPFSRGPLSEHTFVRALQAFGRVEQRQGR